MKKEQGKTPETKKGTEAIRQNIITDMTDGAIILGTDGVIELVNPAALAIFEKSEEELLGKRFAHCFFEYAENDAFTQAVLDAIYENNTQHVSFVPYLANGHKKQLRVATTFLKEGNEKIGLIAVISDLTELDELRDALKAMNRIKELNHQLELRNRLLKKTFGRYLSDDIVREILEKPDGLNLGGQKRVVTILMSDLRGFTAMCTRMEPQALTASLNHYFQEMYEEISRYHGTLVEFLGDGLFIIFGAPIHKKNHAADAVAAAIGMQQRMEAVNRWNEEQGYEPLSMGIGINTGEVVLGNIGSEKRTKYGVMGANVNLTGRIESYTTEGQILISPSTREAIHADLCIRSELKVQPKGVAGEITISEVRGIGAPYERYLGEDEEELRMLREPCPVSFRLVDGKHVSEHESKGELLALSGQRARLLTEEAVDCFDNLVIEIGEPLYAKITEKNGSELILVFTAKPEGFAAWMSHLIF